jgi:hypothetical protein
MTESITPRRYPPGLEVHEPSPKWMPDQLQEKLSPIVQEPIAVKKQIKISFEGVPCARLFQVLDRLKTEGYQVFNRSRTWIKLYNSDPEEHRFAFFLHQITEHAQKPIGEKNGYRFHYGLYGLGSIWFDWLNQEKMLTGGQDQLLRNGAAHLLEPPDYIIYLHDASGDIVNDSYNKAYESKQMSQLYDFHEWILDNTHCPYPLFKINLQDSVDHIVMTVKAVLTQIKERVELEVDTSE